MKSERVRHAEAGDSSPADQFWAKPARMPPIQAPTLPPASQKPQQQASSLHCLPRTPPLPRAPLLADSNGWRRLAVRLVPAAVGNDHGRRPGRQGALLHVPAPRRPQAATDTHDCRRRRRCLRAQPQPKPLPPAQLGPGMQGIRSDEQLAAFLDASKPGTAVVEFGTSWCLKCHEMFPKFYALSKRVRAAAVGASQRGAQCRRVRATQQRAPTAGAAA